MTHVESILSCVLAAVAASACGGQAVPPARPHAATEVTANPEAGEVSPAIPIPNARTPLPGVLTGGQPTPEHLELAAASGYGTVISLRTESEPGFEEERAAADALGLTFVSIPVAGAADLTEDNARALGSAMAAAQGSPLMLHCGSGNRAGALLGLKAFVVDGLSASDATALAEAAGVTSLTDALAERLR